LNESFRDHRAPRVLSTLYKRLHEWDDPVKIDVAVRALLQQLDSKNSPQEARDKLSAMLLASGERAARHRRKRTTMTPTRR